MTPNATPPAPPPAKPAPRRSSGLGRFVLCCFTLGLLVGAAGMIAVLMPGPAPAKQIVVIPPQLGLRGIGLVLTQHGLVYHPLQFALAAKALGGENLKPGEYEFAAHITVLDIVALLRAGKTIIHKFVVPEGLTNGDISRLLEAEPLLQDAVGPLPAEGMLYPATYHFSYGDKRAQLVEQMNKLANNSLQDLWAKRDANLPYATPEQALTLASIVEKETSQADERPRIAGVFLNRLKQGMKLQSDPTVIYALTQGKTPLKRSLTSADLAFPSPYNTYVAAALPPGPIANPGRAALEAVLHPEANAYLYFVADGSGGHAFAKTLDEHNRNVAHWRKLRANNGR